MYLLVFFIKMASSFTRIEEIIDNHKRLGFDHPYIMYIQSVVYNMEPVPYRACDYDEYCSIIPDNLSDTFNTSMELDFEIDNSLLMVLVYHILSNNYEASDMIAAVKFFMKATKTQSEEISQEEFDKIFKLVLLEFGQHILEVPSEFLCQFNAFLVETRYNISRHIQDIVTFLRNVITKDNTIIMNLDRGANVKPTKIAFICLKTLLEITQVEQVPELTEIILINLCMRKLKVSSQNTIVFFREVLKTYSCELWFKNSFLKAMICVDNPRLTVELLKLLDKEHYEMIVTAMINEFVECSKEERSYLRTTLSNIIANPYRNDNYADEKRQKIIERIVHQIFLRLGQCDFDEKEATMNLFVEWYEWKDINLRRTLQQILNAEQGIITASVFFEVFEGCVDLQWKNETYNISFIKLVLNMFHNKPEFMLNRYVRVVEMLCFKGMQTQIEQCMPYITKIIQKYAERKEPAIKPLLGILIHFALIPTESGKRFLFEINNLIKLVFVSDQDAGMEIAVLRVMLSSDMRCKEIFCALESYFPFKDSDITVLFEERTLKHKTVAWKLLSLILDRYEFTSFPRYFVHILPELDCPEFYLRYEGLYILQTINKVFQSKIKKDCMKINDNELAKRFLNIFVNHLTNLVVPVSYANEVLLLVAMLGKTVSYIFTDLSRFAKSCLSDIITKYDSPMEIIVARKLAYVACFLTVGLTNISEDECEKIYNILLSNYADINTPVLEKLILLYGRICLKYQAQIERGMTIFKKGLINHNVNIQIISTTALYDISNLRLQNFDALEGSLLKLVNSSVEEVQEVVLKLILDLLAKDEIRLDVNGSVSLLLLIAQRNINIDMFLKDHGEKEQLIKSEKVIRNCFVHLVFYLNDFRDAKGFTVNLPSVTPFSYEYRCVIYRYLFKVLQRPDQMSVLKILCIEFVDPMYNGTIEVNFQTLMALKDCLTLVSYYAAENVENETSSPEKFYEQFAPNVQKLLVANYEIKSIATKFHEDLRVVIYSLLKTLCKIERISKEMLPQIYNTIALLTTAYYDNVICIVNDNKKIRDLFCVYETYFTKYKQIIVSEPICAKTIADREEWRYYTQGEL